MRPLLFLSLILLPFALVSAETYDGYTTSVRTVDGSPAPSCELVRFRIQEFAKRELEADHIIEWYSPYAQTVEQKNALLEVFRRVPFFFNDRLYEHLIVTHEWRVDIVETEKYRMSSKKTSDILSSKFNHWSDPFNGFFPDTIEVEVKPGFIRLRQKLTFERFCLEDPNIEVRLGGENVKIVLKGENAPELLDEEF